MKTLHVEKGAIELGFDNAIFSGRAENRSAHEQVIHFGLRDWWRLSGAIEWENPTYGDIHASHLAVENVFVLRPMTQRYNMGLGLFAAVEASVHRDSTNAVVFGPIIASRWDKLSVTLNPFFEKTFGRNPEEGIALTYRWQSRYELRERFAVGVEGYGLVENIGNSPRLADQEHRFGPVLYKQFDLDRATKVEPSIGVLFGLTSATPDVTLKFNIDVHFH